MEDQIDTACTKTAGHEALQTEHFKEPGNDFKFNLAVFEESFLND